MLLLLGYFLLSYLLSANTISLESGLDIGAARNPLFLINPNGKPDILIKRTTDEKWRSTLFHGPYPKATCRVGKTKGLLPRSDLRIGKSSLPVIRTPKLTPKKATLL